MSKRTLLQIALTTAALAPTLPEAHVYFWRDARNVANYGDVCPTGAACGIKPIRLRSIAHVEAGAAKSSGDTTVASNTLSTYPYVGAAQLGSGGMAGGGGGLNGSGAGGGGGSGGGGGVNSGSASLQPQARPRPSAPGSSTPSVASNITAPSSSPASQPTVTATSDGQSTQIAANTSTSVITSPPTTRQSPIGTNLQGLSYWTPEIPFVDVTKSSADWASDDGSALDLDANGNVRSLPPGQRAKKGMLQAINGHYPAGRYLVRYNGEGTLSFYFDATVVSRKPGEIVLDVAQGPSGIFMILENTNPQNYIRDIRITMPGGICEGDPFTHAMSSGACGRRGFLSFADHPEIIFYPVFADRLRGYSVLRFMDWMATNNSPVKTWSDRTPVSYSTWTGNHGAPIEVMVALANLVGAHPWFNIPHQADDDYVQKLAKTVSDLLNPLLRVYVEHSNEVWNSMFDQFRYGSEQGARQSPKVDLLQYHALRTRSIGAIFKSALGERRVVTVLGAQSSVPWTATHALDYLTANGFSPLGIDAVAIAPYLPLFANPQNAANFAAMTVDDLFSYVRATVVPNTRAEMIAFGKVASTYKLRLLAYEGGQHLSGVLGAENDPQVNALFDAFNRDQRIKQLYLEYFTDWKNAGGQLFVHFNDVSPYTKWGRWGALEYVAQPRATAPKFDAIQTFGDQNPIWWTQ